MLTAKNGDQISAATESTFTNTTGDSYAREGTFTITGGTGRFADATGTGSISGSYENVPGDCEPISGKATWDGVIEY